MSVLKADLWCLAVGGSFIGWGVGLLRVLRKDSERYRWLRAAGVGIGIVTAFLGLLNLRGWIRSFPLSVLVVSGDLLLALFFRRSTDSQIVNHLQPTARPALPRFAFLLICLWMGCLALAGMHSDIVNYFDDPQAYFSYPLEALQRGSLQSQPFSERRVNTSLGANYLLHAVLAMNGDVRSMGSLDESFGYVLYAAAMWAIAAEFGLSFERKVFLLCLFVLLPLINTNAAPVYLQAALILVLFLVMGETTNCKLPDWRSGIIWGLLASVLCLSKSSGIIFAFLLMAIFAVLHSIRTHSLGQIQNAIIAGVVVLVLAVPWMIQQYRNEGTYFSPILGRGFHASHWGIVPVPGRTATVSTILMIAIPDMLPLILAAFLAWKVRSRTRHFDLSVIAFILTALIATPLIAFGTAGEGTDRFSFPLHIPALLMFAALMLAAQTEQGQLRLWLRVARGSLAVWSATIFVALLAHYHIFGLSLQRLEDAADIKPRGLISYELVLDDREMNDEEDRVRLAQNAIPPGESMLEATLFAYAYDFRRNKVFIADYPGLAGWAPGIPIGRGPEAVGDYFLSKNIHYFICDRRLTHDNEDIGSFLSAPTMSISLHDMVFHPIRSHDSFAWSRMEYMVSKDVRHNLLALAESNTRLYDDGTLVVLYLRANP